MSSCKYPGALPRKMHWSDEIGGHTSCPDCGALLESEHHAYMLVTRRGGDMDFHLVGNTAGHFCEKCPLVVLDRDKFESFVALAADSRGGIERAEAIIQVHNQATEPAQIQATEPQKTKEPEEKKDNDRRTPENGFQTLIVTL